MLACIGVQSTSDFVELSCEKVDTDETKCHFYFTYGFLSELHSALSAFSETIDKTDSQSRAQKLAEHILIGGKICNFDLFE